MKFHKDGPSSAPEPGSRVIFVFGSNLAGIHGGGAARAASEKYGALWGKKGAIGLHGESYAIPTKGIDKHGSIGDSLGLQEINKYVNQFLNSATRMWADEFYVTRIGCVLAGYDDADIAPMFRGAPENCSFAEEWRQYLE